MNGLQHSPQQVVAPSQQSKSLPNGIKSNLKYSSAKNISTNGRRQIHTEQINEKHHEHDMNDRGTHDPVFAKPFKIPAQLDQSLSKGGRNISSHVDNTHNDGGKDVESILKMMTSTHEPLTEIAATPRTEIEVQTHNKSHVYANLPPFLKPPTNNRNTCEYKSKTYVCLHICFRQY